MFQQTMFDDTGGYLFEFYPDLGGTAERAPEILGSPKGLEKAEVLDGIHRGTLGFGGPKAQGSRVNAGYLSWKDPHLFM